MKFEWDEAKEGRNREVHGVSFHEVERFDWETAVTAKDGRWDYGEVRFVSLGFIGDRLYVCVYTQRAKARRIISLRKANKREVTLYEKANETVDE